MAHKANGADSADRSSSRSKKQESQTEQRKSFKKTKERAQKRVAQTTAQRQMAEAQQQADAKAKMARMPLVHEHAAGIDVGDASHWVCVEQAPEGAPGGADP